MDSNFLDLYAGSGSIGIEALSRGAASAVFVEINERVLKIIRENLYATGFAGNARVIRGEVTQVLSRLGSEEELYDVIFIDPPYLKNYEAGALAGIARNRLLRAAGVVVVESHKDCYLPRNIEELKIARQAKYGDTLLSFYSYQAGAGEGK